MDTCEERVSELVREQGLSSSLINIASMVNSSLDFEEIVHRVLMEATKALGSDSAGIAAREDGAWVIRYSHLLPQELIVKSFADEKAVFAGAAPDNKKPVAISDVFSDEMTGPVLRDFGIRSLLAVPLTVKERIIGSLFFHYLSPKMKFPDIEIEFAERAAALLSLALENARLIEERDRLLEQAQEERGRFNAVLEEMPAGVLIAEAPSGKLIRGNEQLERILGHPFLKAAESAEYDRYKGFHHDGRPYELEEWPLTRSIRKGEIITGEEIRITRENGDAGVISVSAAPIRDVRDRIIAGVAVFNDITDRIMAEDALRESESKFRNIASAAQDAVILINNEGTVGFWNDAATNMFGYTSEEMIGKNLHNFIMPERYRLDHVRGFEAFKATGHGKFIGKTYEIEAQRKDGTEFPVELSLAAIKLKDKWNSIGIVRNITQRKLAEEELKKTLAELERSNKELQHFAYAASHDLLEPLRTVASFLQLLSRKYSGKLDEKADKYISFAVDGANRMSVLINDLLTYSRAGTKGKEFAPVNMEEILRQAIANLKMSIEESKAVIDFKELPVLYGDDSQLVQLMQNLISNAIKFRRKGEQPQIRVSAASKGKEWVFGVHDNGIGIDPGFYDRIFTIFQRLHSREEYPGTGIGLAICRKIVERHGGRIWAEAKPGEGSSFYFTMPAR